MKSATNQQRRAPLQPMEAARYLNLTEGYLRKLRVRGDGPPFMKIRWRVMYDPADLDAWLESLKRKSTSQEVSK